MILSIESSCDDSSIAITEINTKKLVFYKKISQENKHSIYGGVVPELAARLHAKDLPNILEECKSFFPFLKAVAVTNVPGLSITLLEGVCMAQALSISLDIPLIGVNHLKGHIYSLFIEKDTIFPITILLVSGGHTQIIEAKNLNDMRILATTSDDSFGESFDKVSKMLSLGYPGGPIVEEYALHGDDNKYIFPVPLSQSNKIEFSYSGLKNAVRIKIKELEDEKVQLSNQDKYDICASFQKTAIEHLMQKIKKIFKINIPINFAIVGGASANLFLRSQVELFCKNNNIKLYLSQLKYCSDNAAMIGRIALEQYKNKDFLSIEEIAVQSKIKGL